MSWRGIRGVFLSACAIGTVAAAPASAWARKSTKAPPKEERLQEPEAPPPSFIAPPPGYEPPPQFQPPGDTTPPPPPYEDPLPGFITLDRMDASSRVGGQLGWHKIDDVSIGVQGRGHHGTGPGRVVGGRADRHEGQGRSAVQGHGRHATPTVDADGSPGIPGSAVGRSSVVTRRRRTEAGAIPSDREDTT